MSLAVSFEVFPPKSEEALLELDRQLARLTPLEPGYVSITYGAGGNDRERSDRVVRRLVGGDEVPLAAHIALAGQPRAFLLSQAHAWYRLGLRRLVALRGDLPGMVKPFLPHDDGFTDAAEFVAALRSVADFDISVAAYPEPHPETRGEEADLEHLKRKLEAGAARAITQYFFDAEDFLRFRDRATAAGITQPIVPGVLPIFDFGKVVSFSGRCGARIPAWLARRFEGLDADPVTRDQVAVATAAELCLKLAHEGVTNFHFYTLNRAGLTLAICRLLGLRPQEREAA